MKSVAPALQLDQVTRAYAGRVVVDDLSLTVEPGEVVCLLGHNGAGKTTTVRMASTLLTPDRGSILVAGVDAVRRPRQARRATGLMLGGDGGFYSRTSAFANLMFYADVAGVAGRERRSRVETVLELVGLGEASRRPVGEFSRGMVQRLHLARALLGEPQLLVLDEPTSAVDVVAARSLRYLVRERARVGIGILLTTHAMAEAEALADRIFVLRHGRIVASGTPADLGRAAGVTAVTTVLTTAIESAGGPGFLASIGAIAGVCGVDTTAMNGRTLLTVAWSGSARPDDLRGRFGPDADLATRPPTLEESYLALDAALDAAAPA